MITILSPAKSLDFTTKPITATYSTPVFLEESRLLIDKLCKLSPSEIGALMKISPQLAQTNYERFQLWQHSFTPENSKQALLAFNGEVYNGINATDFEQDDLDFAQQALRILSGLHGLLRPLDLIMPYRLEMGTKITIDSYRNLYGFWGNKLTIALNKAIESSGSGYLINLASNEYYKAIKKEQLKVPVITPAFKQHKNGSYQMIAIYAKKARGLMSRFIIKNRIINPEELKAFDEENYYYNPHLSSETEWVFTREHK